MANNEDQSFLYRLKLMFDGDDAVAQMQGQLRGVEERVRELSAGVAQFEQAFEGFSFPEAPQALDRLQKEIAESDAALEDFVSGSSRPFTRIERGATEATGAVSRIEDAFSEITFPDAPEGLNRIQQKVQDSTSSLEDLAAQGSSSLEQINNQALEVAEGVGRVDDAFSGVTFSEAPLNALSDLRGQLHQSESALEDLAAEGRGALESIAAGAGRVAASAGEISQSFQSITFPTVPQSLTQLQQELRGSERSLEELVATSGQAFGSLNQTALRASEGTQKAKKQLVQTRKAQKSLNQATGGFESRVEGAVQSLSAFEGTLTQNREKFGGLQQEMQETASAAEQVEDSLDDIEFSRAPRGISDMQQEILQSDTALEELAEEADRTWGNINQGALQAAEGADKVSSQLIQTKNAQEQLNQAAQGYEDTTKKTTQTSQNMLRILQDSQHGMMGMANNFQALAESLARSGTRGRTALGQLMGGITNLLTGPMAVPALVTAFTVLIQMDLSAIPEKINGWIESIKRFKTEVTDTRRALNNMSDGVDELLSIDEDEAFSKFLDKLESIGAEGGEKAQELMARFGEEASSAALEIQKVRKEFTKIGNEDLREYFSEDATLDVVKREAQTVSEEFQKALQEGNFEALADLQEGLPRDELAAIELHARNMGDDIERAHKSMAALRGESIKQEKRVEAIAEKSEYTEQRVREILDYEVETTDQKNKQNEKINEQRRLRELQIEAMEEGLNKRIKGIDLAIDRRQDEIRAMIEQEKISVRMGEKMINRLEEIQNLKEEAAFSEAASLEFTFSREEGADERIDQIKEKYKENRQEILEATDLEPSERREALDRLIGDRDEAISEVEDNTVFIPGQGLVLKDAFISDQKQKLQEVRKEQQRQIESARFRAERGQVGESLLGDDVISQRMEQQRKLIDQEKKARVERLEAEKEFQFNRWRAGEIGYEKYMKNVERKEEQITQVQERAARERVRLVNQQYKQIANSVESSPVGDAVSGLISDLGGIWKGFHDDQFNWQEKSMKERATLVGQMGGQIAGRMSSIAQESFKSWKSERKQDLKEQGKTAEERKKILKKEGKSRFKMVKAMKITEASINTATAATQAFSQLPFPANFAAAAAVTAAGVAKIKKIASMSIGDKLSGGSGGGAQSGGKFTQRSASNAPVASDMGVSSPDGGTSSMRSAERAATTASRVGTEKQRRDRNNEETIKKTAKKVGEEVANQMPDSVTMDRDVAESANNAAVRQKSKLNK